MNIESFTSQHLRKIKMAKRRSGVSLQQVIDFCLDSGDSDLDSSIKELSSSEGD